MRTLALLLAMATTSLFAQSSNVGDVEYVIGLSFMPCEPGEPGVFWAFCPPVEGQGVMVHLRTTDTSAAGFRVTVRFRERDSSAEREITTVVERRETGFTPAVLMTGRVSTPDLPRGVRLIRVTIEKLYPQRADAIEIQ